MKELVTAVDIDAPAETVWDVLVDFSAYPEWNPRTRITGTAAEGERLVVAPGPDAEGMPTFRPTVLRADGTELRWLGHLAVRGLFDGEHVFAVEDLGEDRSRLTQSESFGGLLVGPLMRLYGADTEAGFEAVNAALKERAESVAAEQSSDARAHRPTVEGDGRSADARVETVA
jgi:hypothetical protein